MKKLLITMIISVAALFALPTFAASDQTMDVVPSEMQNNLQQMLQMKSEKMAMKLMMMGVKMYAMGKVMMSQNMDATKAKSMMSNGIKMYNMGMQMNDGKPMDMSKCMGKMKHY